MNTGRLTVTKDWRDCFSGYTINMAQKLVDANYVRDFKAQKDRAEASVVDLGYSSNKVVIYNPPTSFSTNWNPELFSCTCTRKLRRYTYENYNRCVHKAAVLLYWEKQHGPWVFTENEQEHAARLEKEKKELEKKRLKEKIEAEKRIIINAADFLRSQRHDTRGTYFNLLEAVKRFHTNRYSVNQLEKLLNTPNGIVIDRTTLQYGSSNEQELCFNASASDLESRSYRNSLRLVMTRNKLLEFRCSCNRFYGYLNESDVFCVHQLAFLLKVYDYIEENDPGDATDRAAFDFFDAMDISGRNLSSADEKAVIKKTPNVVISPLLNIEDGSVALSFKIGLIGQKKVQLKNLEVFSESVQLESLFNASKTLSIDFSKQDFEENSTPWVNFIHQRVSDTNKVNDKLEEKGRWYYTPTISTSNKDELYGATLDRFYDIAEGTDCECLKKDVSFTEIDNTDRSFYSTKRKKITKKDTSYIHIGHHNMKVSIKTEPLTATNGDFIGVEVTGTMPIIRLGSVDAYIIGKDYVSRITKEEQNALLPFMKAADKSGNICFRIGKERLAEFYYRVIPFMQEHSYIDFTDTCSDMAEKIMPPEPKFTFILDSDDNLFECKVKVAYDDEETILPRKSLKDKRVDTSQETRVVEAVREFFWEYDGLRQCFVVQASEDLMFKILTEGIARFSSFGEVLGTDAFKINKVKSSPQITVGVSVESGIMDISVISKDISPKELLDILESYRLKKKYYKLKSGEFVDLSENDQFDSLTDMADRMNLPMEKLIEEGVKVPAYRALYLNKLLEEREALVSNRDKTYRTLIKNFQTIKDADYEEPEGFKDVLRPYQVYGFKWLKTLSAAGFGGILADEMGLGKTLQAISLMESLKEDGDTAPNLVVCPASLVYNWQEEIKRFAPKLVSCALSGSAANRKKDLSRYEGKNTKDSPDIYITSYDSLRKDITLYEKLQFNVVILDEAQYIKNQNAAMTRAVKVLKGNHRFAMTGTPIENRLAELWSIFDFLMPGFLYNYNEFSSRYETPITKAKDPAAAENLKNMVRPFILRRLKTEVLKDLPDKLEEVRYIRFEDDQRKVYDGQVVKLRQIIENSNGNNEDKMRILAEITKLRQICCDPLLLFENYKGESAKRKGCLDLINSAISGGHRMLVFSQFTSMLALLEEDLRANNIEYYKIIGSTPKEQRIRLVHDFNDGNVPVFLISLKAGGTGLNLTGADVVIHYDPWWNLAAQNQATDRAHRIGQKNTVTVYKMIMKDTIEEKILGLQEAKKDLADAILEGEGKSLFALSGEELLGLLS